MEGNSMMGNGDNKPVETKFTEQKWVSSLELYLAPIRFLLDDPSATEICINRPKEAYVQRYSGWQRHDIEFADLNWCYRLGLLVAGETSQGVNKNNPILSASLPTGERIQFVLPPAAEHNTISIRRPSDTIWTLPELAEKGLFSACKDADDKLDDTEQELLELKKACRFEDLLIKAVKARKTILISGVTGSGKTTVTKALILEVPSYERIITIEDAKELILKNQPNHVRLFYSKGKQGVADVTATELLEACLRLYPTRLFLAELRSSEAFDYLRTIAGHPGSITSIHGYNAKLALAQLLLLIRQSPAGQALQTEEIMALIYQSIDIVVQCSLEDTTRLVKEIWYDPMLKRSYGNKL